MVRAGAVLCLAVAFVSVPAIAPPFGPLAAMAPPAQSSRESSLTTVPGPPWPIRKSVYAPPPETPVDPPPAVQEPAARLLSKAEPVFFGPYVSVQVNVDPSGDNIVGDAANEPTMAVDALDPNRIAIGWRQFDTVADAFRQAGRAYSSDGGRTWTFPGVLTPGQFRSDPVMGSDAFGVLYYSSLSTVTSVEVFRSTDGGMSWAGPVNAYGGDKQWMAVDPRAAGMGAGHVYQFWNVQFSCCQQTDFTRSINGALSFQSPIAIPPPSMKWGTLDTGPDGTLYLSGATLNQTGHRFARSSNAKDAGVIPTFEWLSDLDFGGLTGGFGGTAGPNPDGLLGQVWVAAPNELGVVYAMASVAPPTPDPQDVMFIRSVDNGVTWSAPKRINDDPAESNAWQWFATLSVAPNGRIDAAWNDTRTTGLANVSAVFYTYSQDGGRTWAPNVQITPTFNSYVGFPGSPVPQKKLGDYYHMVSDNGGANLAYSATFNGEQDVYFVRIARDCNDNRIDDDCDVLCGAVGSRCDVLDCGGGDDCNDNFVPDDCEPNEDCNGNEQRDSCESLANVRLDCNRNLVLDDCEAPLDCNETEINDLCDIADGASPDCNENHVPDECDIAAGESPDRDDNGVPDDCVGACCACPGCYTSSASQCLSAGGTFAGLGTICDDIGPCESRVPANDLCADALALPGQNFIRLDFDNTCAGSDGPGAEQCPGLQPFGADRWYTYVAPCTGTFRINMCEGTSFDSILAVYGGLTECQCPADGANTLVCADDTCGQGGGPSHIDLPVTAGRCYTIRVGGWSADTGVGSIEFSYLTVCNPSSPLLPEPNGITKNRFISLVLPAAPAGEETAVRVRLTSLHHPLEPPDAPDFTTLEGEFRYLNTYKDEMGNSVLTCDDSSDLWPAYPCANLGCQPEYRDWAREFGGQTMHITGSAVVPSSRYDVSLLPSECRGEEDDCPLASVALPITTSTWGDIEPGKLNILDITALVDKLRDLAVAPREPRALLHPQDPNPRTNDVTILDIARAADALNGFEYPFAIDLCP